MASKKGKTITIVILAVITAVSFVFWFIPQENKASFSITDYENYLDGVKNIHQILEHGVNSEFQDLLDGNISPEQYISTVEISSSQVTEKISELVTSKPPEEWQESYIHYMDALRKFNSKIRETVALAELIKDERYSIEEYERNLQKIHEIDSEIEELIKLSDQARP